MALMAAAALMEAALMALMAAALMAWRAALMAGGGGVDGVEAAALMALRRRR